MAINSHFTSKYYLTGEGIKWASRTIIIIAVQNSKATIDVVVRPLNESDEDENNRGIYGNSIEGAASDGVLKSSYDYEPPNVAKNDDKGLYGVIKHMTDYPTNNGIDSKTTSDVDRYVKLPVA